MIYETPLTQRVAREMGDTDSSNLYYSTTQLYNSINDAVAQFNIESPNQQYTVIGSEATAYFSPDPGVEDQQLLVLYAALVLTRGEIQKSARSAFSHSNPAGSTNLSRIPEMLDMQATRLENKIEDILVNRCRTLVESEFDGCGVELRGRATEQIEGIGITTIETTN